MNTAYRMPAFFVRLCVFSTHPYFEKTNLFKFFKIEGGTVLPLMACKVSLQSLLATLIAISVANNGNDSAQVAGRCIAYVRPATRIPSALLHVVPMPAWEQRKFSEMRLHVLKRNVTFTSLMAKWPIRNVYGTGGYKTSVSDGELIAVHRDAIGIGRKGTIDKPYLLKARHFGAADKLFYCNSKVRYQPYVCASASFLG